MDETNRRWFAYRALAGGILLFVLLGEWNWMLGLSGWGLCVFGSAELSSRAPHYGTAVVCAGAGMLVTLIQQLHLLPRSVLGAALVEVLPKACALLFFAFLCLGLQHETRRADFGGKIEWMILIALSFGYILSMLLLLFGKQINENAFGFLMNSAKIMLFMGCFAMVADLLRVQKRLARMEAQHD